MSVAPSAADAAQTAATNDPSAAIDTFAFARPATLSVRGLCAWTDTLAMDAVSAVTAAATATADFFRSMEPTPSRNTNAGSAASARAGPIRRDITAAGRVLRNEKGKNLVECYARGGGESG